MDNISKSVRVGTVDFFGIMIPGVLIIAMCMIGFTVPLVAVIMDISKTEMAAIVVDTNGVLLAIFLLIIFSYVLGYILRLSSPDQLDRKSAVKVIWAECIRDTEEIVPLTILEWIKSIIKTPLAFGNWIYSMKNTRQIMKDWIEKDGWPYNPGDPKDKYPYLNFRNYLEKRGHQQLAKELATWGSDVDNSTDDRHPTVELSRRPSKQSKSDNNKKRSKSNVNMMKMNIRLYCPDLSALIESKEAHIRLMSGTWAAFKFSQWPIWIALIVLAAVGFAPQWVESVLHVQLSGHNYFVYMFININLLLVIYFCNQRIEKLFHYRRVSELFHIVQAAYLARQVKNEKLG